MNRLKNTRCYLAGAIEKATDGVGGSSWRQKVKSDLSELHIHWMDPCDKPIACGKETPELQERLRRHRSNGFYYCIREIMLPICRIDLRLVDISDFIIVNIDPNVPTFGTHEEVSRAASQNKPVLVRIEGGKKGAPLWWYERLDPELFFGSWDDLYSYLYVTSQRPCSDMELMESSDYKWLFFDWMGEK